jgi:hypothetical protein
MSYVWQATTDLDSGDRLTNSPGHVAKLRIDAPGPLGSQTGLSVHYVGSRLALDGSTIGGAALADLSLRAPVGRSTQIGVFVDNVFATPYADPGSAEHRQRVIPRDGRTVSVRIEWSSGH